MAEIRLEAVMIKISDGTDDFVLLAIPFFVLAGGIMAEGGMAARLVMLANIFFGVIRGGASHLWVLDPIDGTKSFVTGRPLFGSLIALCRDGRQIDDQMLSVVFNPRRDCASSVGLELLVPGADVDPNAVVEERGQLLVDHRREAEV